MALELDIAADLLGQLGNPTRLGIVRLLVRAGPEGMPVGALQRAIGVPASTLSHHLRHLRDCNLVAQQREGTTLRCMIDYGRLQGLVDFLTEECCANVASDCNRPHPPPVTEDADP